MTRRYVAVGALAVVAVLVAGLVVLVMPGAHEPAPAASTASSTGEAVASTGASPAPAAKAAAASPRAASRKHTAPAGARTRTPAGSSASAVASGALRTGLFTASYPSAWRLTRTRRGGATRLQLSSTGTPIGALDIGPAGTAGVTIEESLPSKRFAAYAGRVAALLALTVGTPRRATDVTLAAPPRTVRLDGVQAAEESYVYGYEGRQNVQSDVIAVRGDRLVFIELDGDPSAARAAQPGFEALMSSWRWR